MIDRRRCLGFFDGVGRCPWTEVVVDSIQSQFWVRPCLLFGKIVGPLGFEWTDEGIGDQRGIAPSIGCPRPWRHVLLTRTAPAPPATPPHDNNETDETEDEHADGDADADANDQGYAMCRWL